MNEEQSERLLSFVQAIAISPADAKRVVARLRKQSERRYRGSAAEHDGRVADAVVARYCRFAATSGGLTALAGVVPGIGTAAAMVGGSATDIAVSMKLQVDMCICLAETFGYDVAEPDARYLAFLNCGWRRTRESRRGKRRQGRLQSRREPAPTVHAGSSAPSAEGALQEARRHVHTKGAREGTALSAVGVAFGAGGNYAMTRFVGGQAKQWFLLDRDTPSEDGPEPQSNPSGGAPSDGAEEPALES